MDTKQQILDLMDDFDTKHLWHPYTSAIDPLPALKVARAYDRTLVLSDGTKLIDAMSSWWCCVHGYNIPKINDAIKEQVNTLSHVMFAGLTHQCAIDLGKKLLKLLPDNLQHIFYADSGSVATEVAMKMAIQYQKALHQDRKVNFITLKCGYHGDTWNAMSVCDPYGMHQVFSTELPQRIFINNPQSTYPSSNISNPQEPNDQRLKQDLATLEKMIKEHHEHTAALILEPIVQGAGGMYFYDPRYLDYARTLCDQYGLLLIFDEIATGFGRTGKLFATNHTHISPDIMLLGKGLTAGYMTLSATVCSHQVAKVISEQEPKAFLHGPTFMANPLACSVACASIDYLLSYDYQAQAKMIENKFKQGLKAVVGLKAVKNVRALGAIGVIELNERANVKAIEEDCLNLGVWLRPMGNLLYAMPPLTTTSEEMDQIIKAMVSITHNIEEGKYKKDNYAPV